jgi:transcriptional regulator with XRE-family HTH domain
MPKMNPLAATGETVRANVRRLREASNLGYAELARRVKATGRGIPELGLRRIEEGRRRVDADDLMALAVALDVSPITLLMPPTTDADDAVALVVGNVTARQLWRWLTAETPLTGDTASDVFGFIWRSVPAWLLGTDIDLIENGLPPNQTFSVRRREQLRELGQEADGHN